MKKISGTLVLCAIIISIGIIHGCSKKTEEASTDECKTCKAFGIDGLVGEEEVCTDGEEGAFRTKYAGKEISCR
jgi:hypothetical protein